MTEQHSEEPRVRGRRRKARTRWDKILLPLTTLAFLIVFIVAMLVIYLLAR